MNWHSALIWNAMKCLNFNHPKILIFINPETIRVGFNLSFHLTSFDIDLDNKQPTLEYT